MRIVMVAAMKYSESDGISKKICMQAAGLSQNSSVCDLFCLGDIGIIRLRYDDSKLTKKEVIAEYSHQQEGTGGINFERDLIRCSIKAVEKNSYSMAYIRHMLPCRELMILLKLLNKEDVPIGYEIPTYPYYFEQLNISHNKIKTALKLIIESIYWPQIYRLIDTLFVVCCNTKSHKYKKMISIYNGFSGCYNPIANRDSKDLEMIGVGSIYPYHGYDLVIKGMEECNAKLSNGRNIYFHIVGESEEIDRLKNYVKQHGLENSVLFYGKQYGEDLQKIYRKANLGVGTMALSLRHADIDTAIKNIEYFSYGLPVITSGYVFDMADEMKIYYKIKNEKEIDFNDIYQFVMKFYSEDEMSESLCAILRLFSWSCIMDSIRRRLKP